MPESYQTDLFRINLLLQNEKTEPRVIAIVGGSYLETYIKLMVKDHLPSLNSELSKRLFDSEGALGSMSPLIDIARAMNLLTNRGRSQAIKLSRVRNRFAHHVSIDSFDHEAVAPIIDQMDTYRQYFGQEIVEGESIYNYDDENMSRREVMICLVREFCSSISNNITHWEGTYGTVTLEDLHEEPHPTSPRKSLGKSRQRREELTSRPHVSPRVLRGS